MITESLPYGLKEYLEAQIQEIIQSLKDTAAELDETYDDTYEMAADLFQTKSSQSELVRISNDCGRLAALYDLAFEMGIPLSEEIGELSDWQEVINPPE